MVEITDLLAGDGVGTTLALRASKHEYVMALLAARQSGADYAPASCRQYPRERTSRSARQQGAPSPRQAFAQTQRRSV